MDAALLVARLLEMKLDEKFDEFFKEALIQEGIAALSLAGLGLPGLPVLRELLMYAHAAGAEAFSEMLREPKLKQWPN